MGDRGGRVQRSVVALTTILMLAFSGCATSPSATSSNAASEPAGPSATALASVLASLTPGSWSATGSLIEPRAAHTATLLQDGTVLVAGGGDRGPGILATAELYDPGTGAWVAAGRMTEPRFGHAATLLPDGRVLVAGGYGTVSGSDLQLASAELYDPDTRAWVAAGRMMEARVGPTATLLPDGRVLVAGGYGTVSGNAIPLASAELYDPDTGSWTAAEGMIEARYDHTASRLPEGTVLVAGGVSSGNLSVASAELYDPKKGTWSTTATMKEVRSRQTATVLLDGSVLLAGGGSGAFAELYHPDTGSWSATSSLVEALQGPFQGHTATLLHDGKVLVVTDPGSAQMFDPDDGTWSAAASMIEAHTNHTATLLLDGRVLVAGGSDADGLDAIAGAALFDPTGGS